MTDAAPIPMRSPRSATGTSRRTIPDAAPRRMVTVYLPLACFVIVLLFPFYWMTVTTFKPNEELTTTRSTIRSGFIADAATTSSACCSRPPIRDGW